MESVNQSSVLHNTLEAKYMVLDFVWAHPPCTVDQIHVHLNISLSDAIWYTQLLVMDGDIDTRPSISGHRLLYPKANTSSAYVVGKEVILIMREKIIAYINANPGCYSTDVAENLQLKYTEAFNTIKELENEHVVVRRKNDEGKRVLYTASWLTENLYR